MDFDSTHILHKDECLRCCKLCVGVYRRNCLYVYIQMRTKDVVNFVLVSIERIAYRLGRTRVNGGASS